MRALTILILVTGLLLGGWSPVAAATDGTADRTGKVTADRLNLRGSPSTTGEVVSALTRDETVTILEEQGEWYRIRLADERSGWVAAKYILIIAETPSPSPSDESEIPSSSRAGQAMTSASEEPHHGGGSFIGGVLKWGCLLGAGACGFLAFDENSKGDSSYDDYEAKYRELTVGGHSHTEALDLAEPLRVDAEDHDKMSQTYTIAAAALGAAFLVQQLFLGHHGDDQAVLAPVSSAPPPLLACGIRDGQVRAAVTLARF